MAHDADNSAAGAAAGYNSKDEGDVGCDSNVVTGGGGGADDDREDTHNNDDDSTLNVDFPHHVRLFDWKAWTEWWMTHNHHHRVQL